MKVRYALYVHGLNGFTLDPAHMVKDVYVKSYDPNARAGAGHATFTPLESEALTFASAADAMGFWKQQSRVMPLRPDGQPNRPLTAYSVEVRKVVV